MSVCVQLQDLTKCYGSSVALSGLCLEVKTGEVLGLLGPNGAGKTTTLYLITGLIRPTSGQVMVFERNLQRHYIEIAGRMGVVVERPSFYGYLSGRDNLKLLARLSGRDVTVDRALDLVGLLRVSRQKVRAYSHGMRQRLALAQALLTEPELLVLDEPTSGLDIESSQEMLRLLRHLAAEGGVTIIISSHMMYEVERLCDRVAIINRGRLVACDETESLLSYDSSHVDALLDAPEAAAKRLADQDWVKRVEVDGNKVRVTLGDASVHQLTAFLVAGGYRVSGIIPRRRTLQEHVLKVLNP